MFFMKTLRFSFWSKMSTFFSTKNHYYTHYLLDIYYMTYHLSQPLGNNSFSYDHRRQLWSECVLVISDPHEISTLSQIEPGGFVVFEEVDNNKLYSCTGLAHTYRIKAPSTNINEKHHKSHRHWPDIIITDNHNHVLSYWLNYISQSYNQQVSLIHIDQHSDLWPNSNDLNLTQIYDPQYQWNFAHLECNIGNFITPCIASGLITNMIQIRTQYTLNEVSNLSPSAFRLQPLIVDIDIDFWAPEMWMSNITATMSQVRTIMQYADLITIATSPYFIDQWLAITLLHELIWPYLIINSNLQTNS